MYIRKILLWQPLEALSFYGISRSIFIMEQSVSKKEKIILPPADKAPLHTGNIAVWIWYFLSPWKWRVCAFFLFRAFRYMWLSLIPVAAGYMINGLESGDAMVNTDHYVTFLLAFMLVYFICMINVVFIPETRVYEKASRALTLYSINHLNALSLRWHEAQGSGGKLQRVMTGRKGLQELGRHLRWDFFKLVGDILAVCVSLYFMDIPLSYAPYYAGFIASYLLCSWYFARPFLKLYDRFHQKFENLLSGVYEFVSAVRTVKAFHLNHVIDERAKVLEEQGQQAIMKTFASNLLRWTICNFVGAIWVFVFAWKGFFDVLNGELTAGAYASVFFLATHMWFSCEVIGSIWEKVYEHGNALSRLIATLRVEPAKMDLEPAQNVPENWSSIQLKDLSYKYTEEQGHGIHDITLNIKRGQKIAFVGHSGAGKSTLVKLLMKQMLADSGEFTVDSVSVSHIPSAEWLSQIGFVPQDVELFNLSLRENILIDRSDMRDEILMDVLKKSALDEFVQSLPEGLDTVIGERGIKLSGGQRQRLGIARALVRQAPIMIFDEATSSLDSLSEAKIQKAIENSFENHTVFVIAHRLSTIRNVDIVVVMEDGRIIEQGSFDELLKKKGHFAELWDMQVKLQKDGPANV